MPQPPVELLQVRPPQNEITSYAYVILEVQMTQIANMKVISLMVDFIKIHQMFYGVWQKGALHQGTQYLNAKI